MSELPERDPLADLVARSLGTRVEAVIAEELPARDRKERTRLRYTTPDGERSVLFERSARGVTLEAQLLPFLARKTDRVPTVHARGLPPRRAALGPWVLLEDTSDAPSGCDVDPAEVVRAKLAIERAVARDEPALRALGVPFDARALPAPLAAVPRALVHGDLRCANARRTERGVVLVGWSEAAIGCPVLDAARLARDLIAAHREDDAAVVRATYARESGIERADELLGLAALVLDAT